MAWTHIQVVDSQMARVKVHIGVVERQVNEVEADLEVMEW